MRKRYLFTFLGLCILGATLALILLLGPARVVVSDSMAPTFRAGDVLWVSPLSGPITSGQIISFNYQGKLITHRVISISGDTLITKGDNNLTADPWQVKTFDVVGEPVFRIPYLGYLIFFLRQPLGWLICVIIPAVWIIGEEIKKIVIEVKKAKVV